MKWEILILTQPSRQAFLEQLIGLLGPEVQSFSRPGMFATRGSQGNGVSISISFFDKSKSLGENRERMRQESIGEYISCFDDDDLPAPNFVSSVLPLLDGEVDQVGFNVDCYTDGKLTGKAYHSLKYARWYQTVNGRLGGEPGALYRDISHLNPMRRELALKCKMAGDIGEDCRWANDMRALGIVKTEHYVDEVLYHYLWRGNKNDAKDALDPFRLSMIEKLRPTVQ